MGLRRLLVHIGSHKTGTTSIQQALVTESELLDRYDYGVLVTGPKRPDADPANSSAWVQAGADDLRTGYGGRIRQPTDLAASLSDAGKNVVMSAENLSWLFRAEEIERLRDAVVPVFGVVEIVCYLRRQDLQAVSHHRQGARGRGVAAARYYGHHPYALPGRPEQFTGYLNYAARIGAWAEVFGRDAVKVRVFEHERLKGSDAVVDFFDVLGLTPTRKHEVVNTAPPFMEAKLGHIVREVGRKDVADAVLRGVAGGGDLLPARDQADAFYSFYRTSNEELNRAFKISSEHPSIFSDDLDMYPEHPLDEWGDDLANVAMRTLSRRLDLLVPRAGDLVEAALALEQTDPEAALRLLRVAGELRPSGPRIRAAVDRLGGVTAGER